ncbi:MAG: tetratricopeptide repeat protein [Spirochaetales bacterium]|nr:tetratricopeptide repeat protein [Spirochaetales bacterium]
MNKAIFFLLFIAQVFLVFGDETPFSLFSQGRDAQAGEDYYSAIEFYKKSLQLNPNYKEPLFGLSESYFFLREFEQALLFVDKSIELDSKNISKKIFKARILIGLGKLADAEQLFNEVLEVQPNNLEAGFGLAELRIADRKLKEAAATFVNTLNYSSNNRRALLSLVLIYDELGEFEKADEYLRKALYYHSGHPQVRYVAGLHYYGSSQLKHSEEQLKTALALSDHFSEAAVLLSRIYVEQGRHEEAKVLMDDIIKTDTKNPLVYYYRGLCHFALSQYLEAMNDMAKVRVLRPDLEIPDIIVEEVLLSSKELLKTYGSRFAKAHLESGIEYQQKHVKRQAEERFRRALQLDENSLEARMTLGRLYKQSNLLAKYAGTLEIAAGIAPDSNEIKDEYEIIESIIEDRPSQSWDINQFSVERNSVNLSLFYTSTPNDLVYQSSEPYLSAFLERIFEGKDWLRVKKAVHISTFAQAFEKSRNAGTDYFVVLHYSENDRSFQIRSSIYKTSSGVLVKDLYIQRTGNSRVFEGFVKTVDTIASLFPIIGRIQKIKGSECIINLGLADGLETGDEIPVLVKDSVIFSPDTTLIEFPEDAVIGKVKINTLDDLVSEATIIPAGIFNLVNTGDELPFSFKNTETYEQRPFFQVNSVLMELFKLH